MKNKQRHGCLTAWLVYLIIAYSIISISYFFNTEEVAEISPYGTSENMLLLIGGLSVLNIAFTFMLFNWIKYGFYGIVITSLIVFVFQVANGNLVFQPFLGLLGIIVLYSLLQLKKNNVSGWNNLE